MRQVTKYTDAIKASVLSKVLAPNSPGVIELAKEFNIPKATIHTWVFNNSFNFSAANTVIPAPAGNHPSKQSIC